MSTQSGAMYAELESWMLHGWRASESTVCILEGVAGVGKTTLARRVAKQWDSPSVEVQARSDGLGVDDLLIEIAEQLEDVGLDEMASRPDLDLHAGLLDALRKDCLVVIDDFDNIIDSPSRMPTKAVLRLVRSLVDAKSLKGRVLLISAQAIADGPWLEGVTRRRLTSPSEEDAVRILEKLLEERCLESEVPVSSRADVARWLGCNPRALQALVGCLADDPLEELIKLDLDAWDLRDQAGSPELVRRLELYFVERTFARLDASSVLLAEYLSVYRKPFTREAVERLGDIVASAEYGREILTSRFLLERNRRWYSLHPIVREIALNRLLRVHRRLHVAHRRAADHFVRHFKSPTVPGRLTAVGQAFVEARFHLLKCDQEAEFESIAASYRRQLISHYGGVTRVPDSPEDRSNLLATLAAVLLSSDDGYHALRGLFAKLLDDRGSPKDKQVALLQATIATRVVTAPSVWFLRLKLAWEIEGIVAGRAAATQALPVVDRGSSWRFIYHHAGMLHLVGKSAEAIDFIESGIEKVPESNVHGLYSLRAFIFNRTGRYGEAIDALLEGFVKLGSGGTYAYRLFEQALFLAEARRDGERLKKLRMSVDVSASPDLASLADMVMLKVAGRYAAAAEVGQRCLQYPAAAAQVVFCLLCCREVQRASEIAATTTFVDNASTAWLRAVLALCEGKEDLYQEEIRNCDFGASVDILASIDGLSWLRLWFEVPEKLSAYPSFYFPRIPAVLTGLEFDIDHAELVLSGAPSSWWEQIRLPRVNSDNTISDPDATVLGTVINVVGGDVNMGDKFKFDRSQVGAAGQNSSVANSTFNQGSIGESVADMSTLAAELELLRKAMRSADGGADADIAVGEIAAARIAAEAGDEQVLKSHLAKAGQWAWTIATSIGAAVAAAAIKAAVGF